MKDEMDKTLGLIYVTQDLSGQKHEDNAIREGENRWRSLSYGEFQAMLNAIGQPIFLLSRELRILWANNSTAKALGKEITDVIGQKCFELWDCGAAFCKDCTAERIFKSGQPEAFQFSISEGNTWDTKAFPIKNENGEITSAIFIADDITEGMTLLVETVRAEQLAVVGELAAGIAHEINNSINNVINCAQLLMDESTEDNNEVIWRILSGSDRIANIVKSLLSFVRKDEDQRDYFSPFDLVTDSMILSGTQLRKEGISVKIYIPPDLPEVHVHQQEIEQVFLNMLNNARYALNEKYPGSHKNKIIDILGEKITINGRLWVQITFYDRGIGIPKDRLGKVMAPFFSTKPRGKGTGLGLSISRKIIIDNDGDIKIDSVEGEFTKVIITLPAR